MHRPINPASPERRGRRLPNGQIFVILAVAIFVMLGGAALAVDIGRLWTTKRLMQSAADAAALAGADELAQGGSTSAVTSAAQSAAQQNGFQDGKSSTNSNNAVTVTVNFPPASGQYTGNPSVVQVIMTQRQPTYFLGALGLSTIPISVTADAMTIASGSCVYSLDPTGQGALTVQGTSSIDSSCGVYVNSDNSSALIASGTGAVTAPLVGVVGGTTLNGGGTTGLTTGIAGFGDPLAYESAPTVGGCDHTNYPNISTTQTLSPGTYCQGLTINAGAVVTFSSGLYIIDGGGLTINGGTVTNGSGGVTFYLTGANKANGNPNSYAGVNIAGNANVNLSAPCTASSGGIEGILFFQDRSITTGVSSTINGGSGSSFSGAMYFPTTTLNYSGTTASGGYVLLISYDLTISGNATIGNNYSCLANGSPIKNSALVL